MLGLVTGLILGLGLAIAARGDDDTKVRTDSGLGAETSAGGEVGEPGAADEATIPTEAGPGGAGAPAARGSGARPTAAGARGGAATGGTGASPAPAESGPGRGVSRGTVKIGVAIPDLGGVKALGEDYDNGDPKHQWELLVEDWRRRRLLPVHGRNIELAFRSYDIFNDAQKRAACVGLVQDEKVFAVVASTQWGIGAECVAREFKTPMIDTQGVTDAAMQRSSPYLFTLQMSSSRLLRNWVRWADAKGHLAGKKIGLYYPNDNVTISEVENELKPELAKVGQRPVAEVQSSTPLGGPEDGVAVQRFRTAGVDLALILTFPVGRSNFLQQAEAQGYRPKYIDNDLNFATGDAATRNYPSDHYNGTPAMTGLWVGDTQLHAEANACVSTYERSSGRRVVRPGEGGTAHYTSVTYICDVGHTLLRGLQAAGPELTHATLIRGLESVRGMRLARHADVAFAASRHHGADQQRTVRWMGDCRCWRTASPFEPLYVD